MAIKFDNLNENKANPEKVFDLEIKFSGDFSKYNGEVTARVKHLTANMLERCYITNADGERTISGTEVFKNACVELHGVTHNVDGREVEFSPRELCNLAIGAVKADGRSAGIIIESVIAQVAAAAITGYSLNEDEIKN